MTVDNQGRPGDGPGLLTLTEAAARTGYSRDALRQRIRRGKLNASKGNDGQIRVHARDLGDLPPAELSVDDQGQVDDTSLVVALDVLRATVDDLRTDLERTRTALDNALVDRMNDHGRAERTEARLAAAEASTKAAEEALEDLRESREEARLQAARAEATAEGLRATLEEARRPFWRRWIG